ncbi:MAG: NAD-dependent epimerase/dehydratase family protein [Deltaproteobacteria bacterium]|jgi:UDP-2-acetamido-2,6-beta-L-arabino-hexul-4-ose reductase|nr:NAD-dependent epimerase/dehydratase family protein [Deltaproteobacteria bacterium]MDL1987759.1 NAD-dependent epimerase/dehydratase family protein [Deltaproteobacteria bacterium]
MKRVLVTGSKGFVGKNLCAVLRRREDVELYKYDLNSDISELYEALQQVDCIIHLAGVNRPEDPGEFETGNAGSLKEICSKLQELGRAPKIVLSSSIQAEVDNPYGVSKRLAEEELQRFSADTGAECVVYRFKNLFGKWGRPDYNSVTATFCHNIANDLPIQISDPAHEIDLTHIDEVVKAFVNEMESGTPWFRFAESLASTRITLGELAAKIRSFRDMRTSLVLPDFSNDFERALYGTYLTYLNEKEFEYGIDKKTDQRGSLAEFLKSPSMGQIFVSRTNPGVTRGDHYHHTKTEKFLVLEGEGVIRFRHIEEDEILEYPVSGEKYQVVDIPPGYTHSIENVGEDELVTLFWASEIFDSEKPDTYFEKVEL